MKLKLPRFLFTLVPLMSLGVAAQEYVHLDVTTGYNHDVVANGAATAMASTTIEVDNDSYAFLSTDFLSPGGDSYASALPATGLINSAATTGLSYQMAPFDENNTMRIPDAATSLTAVFSNQVMASQVFLLATSGSGNATVTITVNFADDTSQSATGVAIPDWYSGTSQPTAASGFGRVNRNTDGIDTPFGNPRLYQLTVNIDEANQGKLIESIEVTKTSTVQGVVNVMGFSANQLPSCPSPTGLTSTTTEDSGTVSWSAAPVVPTGGYDYYMSASSDAPTAETDVTNVANTVNEVTFSELEIGTTYYFWIRSNCGTEEGDWEMTTFTTGQMSTTYTGGDGSTSLNTNTSATSTSPCPTVLTVSVPEGFQIASVDVAYQMTSQNSAYMSEQRSLLFCNTTNMGESAVTPGPSGNMGTATYNRTGLNIADGATGDVEFELRAWRTWGSNEECGVYYTTVDDGTFIITITYEPFVCELTAPEADDQIACGGIGFTVSDLVVEGSGNVDFYFYDTIDAPEPLDPETLVEESGTYYVSQYIGDCESDRTAFEVTVNSVPAPTADGEQEVCPGSLISALSAQADEGGVLLWFTSQDAPAPVGTNTELEEGASYWVTQQISGCRGPRVEVVVSFTDVPLPVAENQEVCEGATVADLYADALEGAELHWYATADAEFALSENTALVEGSYFVSQTPEDCGESDRVEITVSFTEIPVPTAPENQSLCEGATVGDLMATGIEDAALNWYATADAPTPLDDETVVEAGSYFVSLVLEGCGESERVEVNVDFNEIAAPATETNQYFCGSVTVDELYADGMAGATIQWYESQEATEPIAAGTELEPGTYFVRQVVAAGCVSAANDTHVFVNAIPDAPTGDDYQEFESGATLESLDFTVAENATVTYYVMNESDELVEVEAGAELMDDTVYYVTQTVEGCESEPLAIEAAELLGVATFESAGLKVFPNPVESILTVTGNVTISQLTVTNLLGQKVMEVNVNGTNAELNVSSLPQGTYVLQVTGDTGASYTTKIIRK
ncbi:T9SS type A sorting domain-containing protein [Flavobacterium sp. ST-75]|uniref:T9SS type A sorting domain-containing protein n=1 Tax=Flavobacterium rhizophilum TaxID=3163296 RepID=A0ABW8Y9B3_9FLAO